MQELHKRICKMNSMQPFWKWILKCHRFNTQYLLWNIDSHWINTTIILSSVSKRLNDQWLTESCVRLLFASIEFFNIAEEDGAGFIWVELYINLKKEKDTNIQNSSKWPEWKLNKSQSSRASSGGLKQSGWSVTFRKMAFLFSLISPVTARITSAGCTRPSARRLTILHTASKSCHTHTR